MEYIEYRLFQFLQKSLIITVVSILLSLLFPDGWFLHLMAGILAIYGGIITCSIFLLHLLAKVYLLSNRDEDGH